MPVAGDSYYAELKETHLGWGDFRNRPSSRKIIYNEIYLRILSEKAKKFKIYNANFNPNKSDILGVNIFGCTSADGFFSGVLKASGCSKKGDIYAKNLHGYRDLKALSPWLNYCNAQVGDQVEVRWTTSTDIVIRLIHSQQGTSNNIYSVRT